MRGTGAFGASAPTGCPTYRCERWALGNRIENSPCGPRHAQSHQCRDRLRRHVTGARLRHDRRRFQYPVFTTLAAGRAGSIFDRAFHADARGEPDRAHSSARSCCRRAWHCGRSIFPGHVSCAPIRTPKFVDRRSLKPSWPMMPRPTAENQQRADGRHAHHVADLPTRDARRPGSRPGCGTSCAVARVPGPPCSATICRWRARAASMGDVAVQLWRAAVTALNAGCDLILTDKSVDGDGRATLQDLEKPCGGTTGNRQASESAT